MAERDTFFQTKESLVECPLGSALWDQTVFYNYNVNFIYFFIIHPSANGPPCVGSRLSKAGPPTGSELDRRRHSSLRARLLHRIPPPCDRVARFREPASNTRWSIGTRGDEFRSRVSLFSKKRITGRLSAWCCILGLPVFYMSEC